MSFTDLRFPGFLFCVLVLYYVFRINTLRQNYIIIIASYLFYAAWDWRFSLLMVWITVFDYSCALLMVRCKSSLRKIFVALSIISDLSVLGTFKYFSFFIDSTIRVFSYFHVNPGWAVPHIILPIGLSFIVFESMSYTIDVYRRDMLPDYRFSSYALFVSFFPKLVAGPIIRAHTLLSQIENPRSVSSQSLLSAAWLISIGYFLKLVISNNLAPLVDSEFAQPATLDGVSSLLAIYGFAFQIFADFAGYSSIAIGIALLLGFHLPVNFRQPYLVTNPQAFWRHWHISLSTWLRDYLYVSMGGSRRGRLATYRNLFVTMLLGGLWHGASWTFVAWGGYHGSLLMLHRAFGKPQNQPRNGSLRAALGTFVMFQLTCLGWLLFRSRNLDVLRGFLRALTFRSGSPAADVHNLGITVVATGALVFGYQGLQRAFGDDFVVTSRSPMFQMSAFLSIYLAILWFGDFGTATFIYFQF